MLLQHEKKEQKVSKYEKDYCDEEEEAKHQARKARNKRRREREREKERRRRYFYGSEDEEVKNLSCINKMIQCMNHC